MDVTEGLQEQQSVLSLKLEDKDLIKLIEDCEKETVDLYKSKIIEKGETNLNYYLGNHTVKRLKEGSKIVNNVIFRNVETIIPILTSNTPQPRALHPNKEFMEKIRKVLGMRWEVYDKMLEKSRKIMRHNFCFYLGGAKVKYDTEYNDICWYSVHPKFIKVDKNATSIYDCKFVSEIITDKTVKEILDTYKYGKEKLLKKLGIKAKDDKRLGSKLHFTEFSTPDFTVWKYMDVVLDKQKNQNWDWKEANVVDDNGNTTKTSYNTMQRPTVPYIFFLTFQGLKDDEGLYGNTSLIEQSIPLQDSVNKRKRQIDENADEANGTLVASGDFISKAQFSLVKGEARERIWVEKGDARMALARMSGNKLESYVFNDYADSTNSIDNIMGTHSTTRGQSREGDTTATERIIERQQDYGRIDDIVKSYEDFCEDYFNMTLQMMMIHYITPHLYPLENEDDIEISRELMIKEFSKIYKYKETELRGGKYEVEYQFTKPIIIVRRGSTLPTDEVAKQNAALTLAKMNKIDPISLFEDLGDANPELKAKRLFLFENKPELLFPELTQAVGENMNPEEKYTPGMIADTEAIINGETPPVNEEIKNPQTAGPHLQGHSTYIESEEFKQKNNDFKQRYITHTKSEIEVAKQLKSQVAPQGQPLPVT